MILCPSTMCLDFSTLSQEIQELNKTSIDIYHNDIMDGSFVSNIALGLNDIRAIRKLTDKTIDVHLMITDPNEKVEWFIEAGADLVYIHPESGKYSMKTLEYIKSKGKLAGIAISPETSIEMIYEFLPLCDYVLVMTVHLGFAGQSFIETMTDKIIRLIQYRNRYNFKIVVDGNCTLNRIEELFIIGVDGFVLGTSSLFGHNQPYKTIINRLRDIEL